MHVGLPSPSPLPFTAHPWRTALINIQNGMRNNVTRETRGISYRLATETTWHSRCVHPAFYLTHSRLVLTRLACVRVRFSQSWVSLSGCSQPARFRMGLLSRPWPYEGRVSRRKMSLLLRVRNNFTSARTHRASREIGNANESTYYLHFIRYNGHSSHYGVHTPSLLARIWKMSLLPLVRNNFIHMQASLLRIS